MGFSPGIMLRSFLRAWTGATPGSSRRVRLRTLATIRWVAVLGQLAAVLFVQFGLGYPLPLIEVLLVIGASAAVNLWVTALGRRRTWLSDRTAARYLAFDLLQLAALLFLTGGLTNPFAVLILAPVTVAATVLSRVSTATLSLLAVLVALGLGLWHRPLPWPTPDFAVPPVYLLGFGVALALSSLFLAAYVFSVAEEARRMSDALSASQMALDREQRVSALGALAAAAAHELGSPLGTIAVVAKELARDLPPGSPLAADVALLQSQSDRCRAILAALAARPEVRGGPFLESGRLADLVQEAAAAHARPGIRLTVEERLAEGGGGAPPVRRSPEILHGLGTLLQNAIEFATAEVHVPILWSADSVTLTISDDGPGFPSDLLARLGEPYLSGGDRGRGGEHEHMGLGIFIAETLLARSGAVVTMANRPEEGAEVTVRWDRASLAVPG
ncbi:MAG: ActS/PrrB/RegB family redox-sensitive histidine kinase [Dongiaceae bacterium]